MLKGIGSLSWFATGEDPHLLVYLPLASHLQNNGRRSSMTPTFARSSVGTYAASGAVSSAASNEARFEDAGLLIEEARTNFLTYSEDISQAVWSFNLDGVSKLSNDAAAPDGNTTADALQELADTGNHSTFNYPSSAVANTTTHAFSMFVKHVTRDRARLGPGGNAFVSAYGDYDLSAGSLLATGAGAVSAAIESSVGTWYKVIVIDVSANTDGGAFVGMLDDSSNTSYDGATDKEVLFWGAQVEAGAFPTSYIATTTAAVARSADFLSYDDDTVVEDAAGSIYLEYTPLWNDGDGVSAVLVNITDALAGVLHISSDTLTISDGTNTATHTQTFVRGTTYKIAARWDSSSNEIQLIVNGSAGTAGTYDGAFPRTAGTLYVASDSTGNHANGNVRELKIWNIDKGAAALVALTS